MKAMLKIVIAVMAAGALLGSCTMADRSTSTTPTVGFYNADKPAGFYYSGSNRRERQ